MKENNSSQNFYEISKERQELRKVIKELGIKTGKNKEQGFEPNKSKKNIFTKHYQKGIETLDEKAGEFKIAEFGGFTKAKQKLEEQKDLFEQNFLAEQSFLDYETILKENPEIEEVLGTIENLSKLKDFRIKRMLEILNPKISKGIKKINEGVLETIKEEIRDGENGLEKTDAIILNEAKLLEYKKNLNEVGHICITPSTEKDLEAIGERMLAGKPMFLHGPTGTGKTSLARYASQHFTGKNPEMVFCSPQTREANVWGKTGLRPSGTSGAIETVEIYGPLAKAMTEGKVVIFDEFTALPKEQMVFIKGVFNAQVGDKINIVGNGLVEIKPGFQMIFTANLKSEKNPERQELPPEIAREFEQNNLKIKYTPADEAYDIILARLLNKDGSLDMSYFDLNETLPNLCRVMSEIQESYTSETNKEVAKKAGAMDASGKFHSLKKFVMTQGSVEAILSSYLIEKKVRNKERSFSEFLDERFKTALTFEEYSKEDRILVAKILASKGFLLTLSAEELSLPEDIFKLNTIKSMRGDEAVEEMKEKSSDIKHLSLREVAELDPFKKRKEKIIKRGEAFLEEGEKSKDSFLNSLGKNVEKIFGKEKKIKENTISTTFTYTNPDTNKVEFQETITLNIEDKLNEYEAFYQKHQIDLPPNFADTIKDIWEKNYDEIQKEIETNGFNEILLMPANLSLPDLHTEMTAGYNDTYQSDNFTEGGSFTGAKSANTDKIRLVLTHNAQNLKDHPILKKTLNTYGKDVDLTRTPIVEDYLVHQRKYEEANPGKHLDVDGWTWLATMSGARLVRAGWHPGGARLRVIASGLGHRSSYLGVRTSRSFFQ